MTVVITVTTNNKTNAELFNRKVIEMPPHLNIVNTIILTNGYIPWSEKQNKTGKYQSVLKMPEVRSN